MMGLHGDGDGDGAGRGLYVQCQLFEFVMMTKTLESSDIRCLQSSQQSLYWVPALPGALSPAVPRYSEAVVVAQVE